MTSSWLKKRGIRTAGFGLPASGFGLINPGLMVETGILLNAVSYVPMKIAPHSNAATRTKIQLTLSHI
jgi:hypothetical protein